jgi:TPR repeat protein
MPEASEFLDKAQQGDAMAQCFLGCCYEHGWGVKADRAAAEKWYLRSALQDYGEAQSNLGWFYGAWPVYCSSVASSYPLDPTLLSGSLRPPVVVRPRGAEQARVRCVWCRERLGRHQGPQACM